jgi:beta-phosphoglucomutase-like phosphatase (HAD superfamily)
MTGSPTAAAALAPFDAVIFDLDGVVTDTASVHAAAWTELFDEVLKDPRVPADAHRDSFRSEDYLKYVDGRPREEGVKGFLASRGIVLPEGHASDTAEEWSIFGLGAHKNRLFKERLDREGVLAFPGTVALIQRLREAGVPVALATASRNATGVLAAAGLAGSFDLVLDGIDVDKLNIPGKP